jgi:NADPH:quinone reductase-like Zn-dependent oxidoreductase
MKAVVQKTFGGPEALSHDDVPDPDVGPRDVLLHVGATSLNRLDVLQRQGPPLLPGFALPHIAGMDVAGSIVEVGPEVESFTIGDRVLVNPALECGGCEYCRAGDDGFCPFVKVVGGTRPGGYAELCSVPADHLYRLPENVDFEEAATIPTAYSTAWHAIITVGALRIGETLLVHGAGSGVTIAAIQIGKQCGARVIVTSRSEKKLELAERLGADGVINTSAEDVAARCRELTAGRGADLAFDHVGPDLFQQTIFCLRPRGRVVFAGTTTGAEARFDLAYTYHFGIALLGVDPYPAKEFGQMLDFYWQGGFEPVIDSRFPLADAAAAQVRMESGEATGKILLLP